MKTRNLFIVAMLVAFLSGCVVYSFYPLYTKDDLFANDILTGNWVQEDSTEWNFEHAYFGKKVPENIDSTSYVLTVKEKDGSTSEFSVHIIQLGGQYFLDFYLENFLGNVDIKLADLHVIPVHTFAKLTFEEDGAVIRWYDQNWLEKLIKENKIRIRHESNGDFILLTAGTKELQKFVTKYVDSEEAFKEGMGVYLIKN